MKKHFITVTSLLAISTSSYSQEMQDTLTLDDAIVLSSRIDIPLSQQNRNIEIISSNQLRQWNISNVNQALQQIAGVDVLQRGAHGVQADIAINGGSFDQTLVLLNGMRMSDAQTGHNMMNLPIDLSAIDRIEILRGPAASIYGVNAMNGVINIVTKTSNELFIDGSISIGSSLEQNDSTGKTFLGSKADIFYNQNWGNFTHQLGLGMAKGNGYRFNTQYQNFKIFYAAQMSHARGIKSYLQAGYTSNKFGANAFYAAPRDLYATEHVKVFTTSLKVKIPINNHWTMTPSVHYRKGFDHYIFNQNNPNLYQNIHHTHSIDMSVDNQIVLQPFTIGFGITNRIEQINSTNLGDRKRNNLGAFANVRGNIGQNLDYTAGIFVNNNSVFKTKVYPSFDIGYKLPHQARLYASVGTGQRIPTFTDLYYSDPANEGNPLLTPELAVTYELGYKQQWKRASLHTAIFYRQGNDYIDWFRGDSTQKWKPLNLAQVSTLGFNLQARADIWKAQLHHLSGSIGYTYLSPKYNKKDEPLVNNQYSKYIINNLAHHLVAHLDYVWNDTWTIALAHRYAYRLNTRSIVNGYSKQAYQLFDARIAYKMKWARLFIDIANISNVQYIETGVVPLPGRWYQIGIIF